MELFFCGIGFNRAVFNGGQRGAANFMMFDGAAT